MELVVYEVLMDKWSTTRGHIKVHEEVNQQERHLSNK